jgi:hypothetical protein
MEAHSQIDWSTVWATIVLTLIISTPIAYVVGVLTIIHTPRLVQYLDKRNLLKRAKTKKQALGVFNLVKSFRDGTRDRYPFYIILASGAIICAMTASTLLLIIAIQNGGLYPISFGYVLVALMAVLVLLFAALLLALIYDTARQIERFDAYKLEFEKRWGSVHSSE